MITSPATYKSGLSVSRLLLHEASRVYSDRMIVPSDCEKFTEILLANAKKHLSDMPFDELTAEPNVFGSFVEEAEGDQKMYLPLTGYDHLSTILTKQLNLYNEQFAVMNLVLFNQAMEHISRISRIIDNPRGNALLVGVGGSGKQSLTRLGSYICNATCFQITLTKTYNGNNLLEDFKPLYRRAGVQAKPTVFMLTDKEIKDEGFLEFFNIFLNTGELPNLFPRDELDAIIGECREKYQAMYKGSEPTVDELWAFFIERVRSNLHLSLCFSPVGVKLSRRAQQFPGLINGKRRAIEFNLWEAV